MKIFTHSYIITIFENGRFCWKKKGWIKSDTSGYFLGIQYTILMLIIFLSIIKLCNEVIKWQP
jgi:hypothetical protein